MDCQGFQDSTIYVVVLTYIKPLEEVDRAIPAHIEWLKKGYADGLFLASGRRIPRTGGVILAKCDSRETLQARLSQIPSSSWVSPVQRLFPLRPAWRHPRCSRCYNPV